MIIENTKLLDSLLSFLPPCFNTDPEKEIAFSIDATIPFTVEIVDTHIKLWTSSVISPAHEILLTGKTISQLASEIDLLPKFTATNTTNNSSAFRLIPGKIEDGRIYMFTNNTWAIMQACALELGELLDGIKEVFRHLAIPGATGNILDYWGSFFDIDREAGESDAAYSNRIIVTVQLIKSNNVGMAQFIKYKLGHNVHIMDFGRLSESLMLMNDTDTPMHDIGFSLVSLGLQPVLPCTFGIVFEDPGYFQTLSAAQKGVLKNLVHSIKQAGTCSVFVWYGLGSFMLMNNTGTPVHDTDWPVADCTYGRFANGYYYANTAGY